MLINGKKTADSREKDCIKYVDISFIIINILT